MEIRAKGANYGANINKGAAVEHGQESEAMTTKNESDDMTTKNETIFIFADRAGIAWGADASWTDATSPEDALERFASDRMCPTIPSEAETHSTIAAVEAAAVETDQDWDDESTTFIFADGSKLKICGDEWIAS